LTTASSKEISPSKCETGGQPEINVAAETGNANIFGTMPDKIEILTTNLGFLIFAKSKKLSSDYCFDY